MHAIVTMNNDKQYNTNDIESDHSVNIANNTWIPITDIYSLSNNYFLKLTFLLYYRHG